MVRWTIGFSGGLRTLGTLGLLGLFSTTTLGCDATEKPDPGAVTTTGARTSTDPTGGSGGGLGQSVSSSGAPGGSGGAPMTDTGGTTASNLAGAAGRAGSRGVAGAGPDEPEPLTCESFPHEAPNADCEPKLRAILSSRADIPQLTFEYDAAGRLATVGDDQSHASYVRNRYHYDDQGRLSRIESDCDPERAPGTCTHLDDFSYAEAGWLQTTRYTRDATTPDDYEQTTYGEAGQVLEVLRVTPDWTDGTLYRYRPDGQPEGQDNFVEENGVRNVTGTEVIYEYGDDDVLDSVVHAAHEDSSHQYHVEAGRVRVEYTHSWATEVARSVIFDDFGRPAFEYVNIQADDRHVSGYVDGRVLFWGWEDWATPESRTAIEAPRHLFPYRPLDLTANDVDDFSYSYDDIAFARHVRFSEDGLLEHVTISWGPSPYAVTIDTERCGEVVLETTRFPHYGEPNAEVRIYYYGCDDFVLPTPLPEL